MKKILNKFRKKKKFELKPEGRIYNDWGRAVVMFFALVVMGAIAGTYGFMSADNIEANGGQEDDSEISNVIDEKLLHETIEFYSAKREKFEELKSSYKGAPRI